MCTNFDVIFLLAIEAVLFKWMDLLVMAIIQCRLGHMAIWVFDGQKVLPCQARIDKSNSTLRAILSAFQFRKLL